MKVDVAHSRINLGLSTFNVDFKREAYVGSEGQLVIPLERGLNVRVYPNEESWVKVDRKGYHVNSKDKCAAIANDILNRIALARLK